MMLTDSQRVAMLEVELTRARDTMARMRKRLQENARHGQRVARAYDDAMLLATLHVGYQSIARDELIARGILTKRRWTNAVGLLRLARVFSGWRFTVHTLAEIERALETARRTAIEDPERYFARLPRHALR